MQTYYYDAVMIDKQGYLRLKRKTNFMNQYCPFSHNEGQCGIWCPLFSEPQNDGDDIEINLCRVNILCDSNDFTDERTEGE